MATYSNVPLAALLALLLGPAAARAQQSPADAAKKAADETYRQQQEHLLRNDWGNLQRYAAANQRLPSPAPGTPRVVLMGNSIIEGWPRADSAFFASSRPYAYIGRGISGQTTGQMLVRFRQDAINLRPAVVVILTGTNDVAENSGPYHPQTTLNNIMSIAELARAHGIRVVLCSVTPATDFWWRKGLNPAPKITALNQQLRAYAQAQKLVYLDLHAALADQQQGLKKAYGEDGVHPNLTGYRAMEPLLQQAVAEALKTR